MLANLANAAAVVVVAVIGSRLHKGLRKEVTDGLMKALGIFILYLGITGLDKDTDPIAMLISVAVGAAIGTLMDWDGAIERMGAWLQKKLSRGDGGKNYAQPMVTYFLASCTGAYTIVACFNAGMGDSSMLYTKVVIDVVIGLVWAASMGIGLGLSAIPIFLYQTALILLSGVLSPVMTEQMLDMLGCMGGLLTMAIGINVLGMCQLKIANYIPCMIVAPIVAMFF